jgi:hypothetical protein
MVAIVDASLEQRGVAAGLSIAGIHTLLQIHCSAAATDHCSIVGLATFDCVCDFVVVLVRLIVVGRAYGSARWGRCRRRRYL